MSIITEGNLSKLMQDSINYVEELDRLMNDPNNKILAIEIKRLQDANELLQERVDSLSKKVNQWNPL